MTLKAKLFGLIGWLLFWGLAFLNGLDHARKLLDAPTTAQLLMEAVRRMFTDPHPGVILVMALGFVCLLVATSEWWLPWCGEIRARFQGSSSPEPHDGRDQWLGRPELKEIPGPPPPEKPVMFPLKDAARRCFDETGYLSDVALPGDVRQFQFVALMVIEGRERPELLKIWGIQRPGTKLTVVPPNRLETHNIRRDGDQLAAQFDRTSEIEWDGLAIENTDLEAFIQRLKDGAAPI